MHGAGNDLGEGNAYEDEDGACKRASAKPLAEDEEGCKPCEDGLQCEDEGGVGGGQDALRVGEDREGEGGGEDGRDGECGEDAWGPVNVGVIKKRQGDRHDEGTGTDLDDCQLLKREAGGKMGECDDLEGEAEGADTGEDVAEVHVAEGGKGNRVADGSGEQDNAEEGDDGSEPGVPVRALGRWRPQAGDDGEQGDDDDDQARDEGGFGGSGQAESGSLELIAGGETEAGDGAGDEDGWAHPAEVATVDDGEDEEGERHADEIEEER